MSANGALAVQQPAGSLASLDDATMQNLISGGDCSRLSPAQKSAYYVARCEAAGLDPRAQPFAFMRLNGKETLYALKSCSDQLAAKHGVRLTIVSQATEDGIRVVTVRAEARDGRVTEDIGSLPVKGLSGDALANALMKCVTKAKRRAVLSLCGLGMLDETEVESIPAVRVEPKVAEIVTPKAPPAPPPAPEPESVPNAAAHEASVVDVLAQAGAEVSEELSQTADPEEIDKLWKRTLAHNDGNRTEAGIDWGEAATRVFGRKYPDAKKWTRGQLRQVERYLFPPDADLSDVPF